VAPVASVLPMTFSGGGSAPLARLADGGRELAVSWPAALPAPVLSGDTAVYPEVLPGVDLRVTASAIGFSEVPWSRTGRRRPTPPCGRCGSGWRAKAWPWRPARRRRRGRDPSGRVVFSSPAPVMWDSSADALRVAPGPNGATRADAAEPRSPRSAVMAVQATASELSITPDPAMLTGPGTVFPLYVDPSWTGRVAGNAWTSVWSRGRHPEQLVLAERHPRSATRRPRAAPVTGAPATRPARM
jgi:hypothetical protein